MLRGKISFLKFLEPKDRDWLFLLLKQQLQTDIYIKSLVKPNNLRGIFRFSVGLKGGNIINEPYVLKWACS